MSSVMCVLTALGVWAQAPPTALEIAVAVGCVAAGIAQLWWPVSGACAASLLAVLSPIATPAATVGALQVAWRGRFGVAVAVAVLGAAAHLVQWFTGPEPAIPFRWWAVLVAAVYGALLAWGAYARSRRDLLISLRQRAVRAEAEQGRRVAEARAAERRDLAREMHDVLAHRLTLVATHAGALEYRPDAPPERLATAAGVVREGVHQALDELRQVIGLLREEDGVPVDRAPPGLELLPALLDDARAAGQRLQVRDDRSAEPIPAAVGRAAYRVLQEGLTNARKHAPDEVVEVSLRGRELSGRAGPGLEIEVRTALPAVPPAAAPGSGLGLVGLTERVRLVGGRLDHGRDGDRFGLRAWLPWPP
jgi:signal transduction histidine kinase